MSPTRVHTPIPSPVERPLERLEPRRRGERASVLAPRPRAVAPERSASAVAPGRGPGKSANPARRETDSHARLWRVFSRRRGSDERNALVETYQGLVSDSVRRFAARLPRSVDVGDLLTAANVGLIAAIESFDRRRGVPFESWCELRVRGALLDELRSQDWLPRPWRARLERHKRVLEGLRSRLSREPSEAEIAFELGLSLEEYRGIFTRGVLGAPTSGPIGEDEDDPGGIDVVPDTLSEAPEERMTREDLLELVAQKLSPQEYRIVYLKYWEDLSLREIGELEGLSESRVCKIHMKLLERLQERLRTSADA